MASPEQPRRDSVRSQASLSTSQRSLSYQSSTKESRPRPNVSTSASPSARRSSNASIASVSSSIGTILENSTSSSDPPATNDFSQNSISSLLSHPIVRTGLVPQSALSVPSAHRPPSARDIPPVTLTPIPHVDSSAFRPYLSGAGALYDVYQRSKLTSDDQSTSQLSPGTKDISNRDYFEVTPRSPQVATPLSPNTPRANSLSSPPSPTNLRRTSSGGLPSRRDKSAPTPLSTIPSVYFDDNFQLANPRTFDVVSERSDVIPPDPQTPRDDGNNPNDVAKSQNKTRRKALHTNAILQEKLSWYMDTVEVHLISSIATASSSFFAALGSLKELQSEATESISKIQSLRGVLRQLDEEMARGGLQVLSMKRRRENLRKLADAVAQLCEVTEEAKKCEAMVDNGELADANSRIDSLEDLIAGGAISASDQKSSPPRVDLRQLKSLEGISDGIMQLRQRISRGYETRFIEALLADLRTHVNHVPPRDTIQRWASASLRVRGDHSRAKSTVPAYLSTNDKLRPELLTALEGLARAGQTARAATAYREAIMREIKSMVRQHLPSSSDDDNESVTSISTSLSTRGGRRLNQQEKSSILARNLRALDSDSAEELLVKVYTSVGEALRRLGVQVKVVLDVTSSIEQPAPFPPRTSSLTPSSEPSQIQDEVTQALDMSSLLGQAVDVIQTQVTKVLKVRNEQNSRLPLQQFLRYFTLNRLFTDECEAVSSRGGEGLKEAVNAQVKEFLQVFADGERQRIIQILEADRWDVKDFGPSEALVLDRVLESMDRMPKAWTEHVRALEESPLSPVTNGGDPVKTEDASTSTAPAAKTRPATIDVQPYFMVHSTVSALHGIESFLILSAVIPSLTVDCALKLLEYIKAFNSRCCQLILGAGATKSAGLKNITSKHLALASQACSFLIALVPYMREFVRRQTGGNVGNVFAEFDKVKRLLQEHQSSIHEKLVDIMSQRSAAYVQSMKNISWDGPDKDAAVNPYMESLTKETGTLHRVLSRYLSETDLRMIMTPIFAQYSREWSKAFREAPVRTEAGKARMLRDVEYLDSKFSKLDGSGDFGPNLVSLVQEKQVSARLSQSQAKAAPPSETKVEPTTTPAASDASAGDPAAKEPEEKEEAQEDTAAAPTANANANDAQDKSPEVAAAQEPDDSKPAPHTETAEGDTTDSLTIPEPDKEPVMAEDEAAAEVEELVADESGPTEEPVNTDAADAATAADGEDGVPAGETAAADENAEQS